MKIKMSLLENAYDFLNVSLFWYSYTDEQHDCWKFAIVNIIQAMELMFKECLRRCHPVLIYDNVDKQRNTVSLSLALDRMINIAKLPLDNNDKFKILKAIDLRNQIMHYEFECPIKEAEMIYSMLFEFITKFHLKYLDGELHHNIQEHYWEFEAYLMELFNEHYVVYNGVEISKDFPSEIIAAQDIRYYSVEGKKYPRLKYGEEPYHLNNLKHRPNYGEVPCHDCAVVKGQYHVPGCDMEECPKCGEQAISCDCVYEDYEEENDDGNI